MLSGTDEANGGAGQDRTRSVTRVTNLRDEPPVKRVVTAPDSVDTKGSSRDGPGQTKHSQATPALSCGGGSPDTLMNREGHTQHRETAT